MVGARLAGTQSSRARGSAAAAGSNSRPRTAHPRHRHQRSPCSHRVRLSKATGHPPRRRLWRPDVPAAGGGAAAPGGQPAALPAPAGRGTARARVAAAFRHARADAPAAGPVPEPAARPRRMAAALPARAGRLPAWRPVPAGEPVSAGRPVPGAWWPVPRDGRLPAGRAAAAMASGPDWGHARRRAARPPRPATRAGGQYGGYQGPYGNGQYPGGQYGQEQFPPGQFAPGGQYGPDGTPPGGRGGNGLLGKLPFKRPLVPVAVAAGVAVVVVAAITLSSHGGSPEQRGHRRRGGRHAHRVRLDRDHRADAAAGGDRACRAAVAERHRSRGRQCRGQQRGGLQGPDRPTLRPSARRPPTAPRC